MSNIFNDEIEQRAYEIGYDKGYEDCRSEMELKIKAVMKEYMYSEKFSSPWKLNFAICEVLKKHLIPAGDSNG